MRRFLFFLLIVCLLGGLLYWFVLRKPAGGQLSPIAPLEPGGPQGTGTAVVANPEAGQPGNDPYEEINPGGLPDGIGTTIDSVGYAPGAVGFSPGEFIAVPSGHDVWGQAFVTAPFRYNSSYNFI